MWSIAEQTHGNMESIFLYNKETTEKVKEKVLEKKVFYFKTFRVNISQKSAFAHFGKHE